MACCSSSPAGASSDRTPDALTLEFLFLDETVCKPCGDTGQALDEAVGIVAAPLAALGLGLEVERVHVLTREDAIVHRLTMSPTIRVNGVDIDPAQTVADCGSCGEIGGGRTAVNCRTWRWRGETFSSAPTGKIVAAILGAAAQSVDGGAACCATGRPEETYAVPENLENFFRARHTGERLCC